MRDKIKLDIQRFANISNSENDTVITGTAEADSIYNDGSNVTIQAFDGNDTVMNNGSNVTIDAGAGNDTIFDASNDVSINAGVGDNYVEVSGCTGGTVVAEGGNNYVSVAGSNDLIITAGSGKDTIANYGYSSNVTINSGAGNDSVYNEGENVWIKSDSGDDSISNYGSNVTIDSGDGDDYINAGSSVTINTGEGNNTVLSGSMAFVNTGSGNNIVNFSDDVTVNSGGNTRVYKEGGDTLELGADGSATLGYEVNAVNSLAAGGSWSVVGSYRSVKVGNQSFEFVNSNEFAGVLTADNSDGSKIVAISGLSGNVSVNLDSISGLKVSDNAWTISSFDNDTVNFDSTGTLATVTANADSELTIATTSNSSVNVQHDNQTLKANVNGVKVVTSENYNGWLNLQLDNSGLAGISGPFGEATIEGDNSFKVNDSFEIENIAGATTKFSVDGSLITIRSVKDGDNYNVNGGYRTVYELAENDSAAQVSLNGESITISSASSDVQIVSAEGDAIASITGAYLNDKIRTTNDKAFWVTYDTSQIDTASDDTYSIQINDAVISMKSSAVDTEELSVYVDNSSSMPVVSISSGIAYGSTLSVSAGVYYVGWGEAVTVNESTGYLYLDSNGNVTAEDSSVAQIRIEREQAIAALVSSLNGGNTTVQAFKDFYNLYDNFPSTFTATVAGYENGSVTSPSTTATSTGVNIYGDNSLGANPKQITLQSHLSDPINIEHIEGLTDGQTVRTAVIDASGSKNTLIALGMNEDEDRFATNHTILGSDEQSTILVGPQATGNHSIKAGNGGDFIYHNAGGNGGIASIFGGSGSDSIFASNYDYVEGGSGADYFYDGNFSSSYNGYGYIQIGDYNADEGDVIIVTKLAPGQALNADNVSFTGDAIAIAGGNYIQFGYGLGISRAVIADSSGGNKTNVLLGDNIDASTLTSGAMIFSSYSTVRGSTSNDTIYNGYYNNLFRYYKGDGNDTIYNFGEDDTLEVVGTTFSTVISGNDFIVNAGGGSVRLVNAATIAPIIGGTLEGGGTISLNADNSVNNTVITGTAYADSIVNSGANVTISGLGRKDTISNTGNNVSILGGADDDKIVNAGLGNVTINNGIYLDRVTAKGGANVTIEGGAGQDTITNSGNNVTINGGADRDTIYNTGSGNVYQYSAGNDVIVGVTANDTLIVNDTYSTVKNGNDLIVMTADNKVTFKDAANIVPHIVGTPASTVTEGITVNNSVGNTLISGTAGNDSIVNTGYNVTINTGLGNDTVINSSYNSTINGANINYVGNFSGSHDVDLNGQRLSFYAYYNGGLPRSVSVVSHSYDPIVSVTGLKLNDNFSSYTNIDVDYPVGEKNYQVTFDTSNATAPSDIYTMQVGGRNISLAGSAVDTSKPITVNIDAFGLTTISGGIANNSTWTVYGGGVYKIGDSDEITLNAGYGYIYIDGNGKATGEEEIVVSVRKSREESIHSLASAVGSTSPDKAVIDASNTSVVAFGMDTTQAAFSTNHTILGGDKQSTIMVGSQAKGDIYVKAGNGGSYLYHNGDGNTSLIGGTGADTFSASTGDYVEGKGGADYFLDTENYQIADYNADEGDIIMATRLSPYAVRYAVLNPDIIQVDGNKISVADGATLTLGSDYDGGATKAIVTDCIGSNRINLIWAGNSASVIDAEDFDRSNIIITSNNGNTADTIIGSAFVDTIYSGSGDYINSGAGRDIISLSTGHSGVSIELTQGMDTVYNFNVANDTILALESNGIPTLKTRNNDLIVYSGEASLQIVDGASLTPIIQMTPTIISGYGNNTVDNTVINGTEHRDHISNSGSNVTINAYGENDTIRNSGADVLINADTGNDEVNNSGSNVTINGGEGNDRLYNIDGSNVVINGNEGNNTILNYSTSGNSNVTINGGTGNDSIYNEEGSSNVTINGSTGDDTITNKSSYVVYQYVEGDGNDIIEGFTTSDTLVISSAVNETAISGDDFVVKIGEGSIILTGAATLKPNIVAPIENTADNTILTGTAYDDTITNSGSNVTINALAGNDTITNTGSSVVYKYSAGDGNDVIVGFTDSDTLIISSDTYRTSISGNDLIVTVVGSENFITLKDAANLTPIIIGAEYSGYRDKDGKEIENPVAMIASSGVTYYYESVARATNDADNNSTVTVIADSTETAQINATKGLTIQFAESGLGVYSVSGGNFISADTSQAAQFSISSNRVLSNSNSLLINNGSTATVDGYAVTGTSNGYTFALQDNSFTLNNISYSGTGTANFNTSGNVSVTSGAIITGNNEITSSTGIGLSEGNYTINGVEFSVASNNTAQTTADGVKFNLSSDTVTYNSMTFSGAGTATIQSDTGIYLTGGAVVSNVTAGQAFTFNGTGTFKLNNKTIVSSATSLTVTYTAEGLTIGENTFSVTSDEEFTLNVDASGKIVSASNINGGSTIVNAGGADSILTSSSGNFTFAQDNNKVFNIAGGDSVTFGLSSDGAVTKIADVIGTVSGDFTNAININGNAADIWIGGDNSVSFTAENKGASEIRGVSNNATIQGTGGASTVTTDEEGTFNFYDSQHVTVSGDSSVDFILRDSIVTGVANFENGTYFLDNTAQISVNADSLTLGFTDTATLVISDSQVVSVDGVEGHINGLTSDATVHATGAMTVNGSNVNVSGDNDFNVIVSDGKTSGLANISSGASVSVAGMNVTTDNNGDFKVGEYVYSINDSDGSVTFITNSTGSVENIIGLNGTLTTTARNVTINSGTFTTTNTDVTISSAGLNITRVDGLSSGDSIGGNLDSSTVVMPATTDTNTSVLTINERSYRLGNDSDGVLITGNRIDGLNSGASLTVGAAGSYLVNNTALDARIGDIFIGTSEGAAYIYDPNNVPLDTSSMSDEEITSQVGITTTYNTTETDTGKTAALLASGENLNGSMELALSNSDTTTAQTADFSNSTGVKKVTLKEGTQEIKFNDEGGNVAIIESSSAGEKNVSLGGGGDLVIVKETETPVNITAGSGKDTIVTAGNNVKVGMKGGATRIVANSGNVEVANYDASTGAGIQIDEFSDIRRAVANDNISLNNGSISFGTSTVVVNNTESESTTVNLYDNKGRKQKVAYTHNDGGKVDASGERENLLLVGNKNMDKGNANLVSGRGNDSALGGAGDYFDLGAGNNYVSINSNRSNATEGATVAVTAKEGKTEVDGFRSGFAETADKVMFDLTNAQVSFKNGKLTFDIGGASLVLNFMGNSPDLAESADLISDNNFICDTTLDDITPMTFEQGESQNWYDTTFTTASDTLSSGSEITFAGV